MSQPKVTVYIRFRPDPSRDIDLLMLDLMPDYCLSEVRIIIQALGDSFKFAHLIMPYQGLECKEHCLWQFDNKT